MRLGQTVGHLLVTVGAIVVLAMPVMAGNGKGGGLGQGSGDQTRSRTQSRLKDGSCKMHEEQQAPGVLLTSNGTGAGDCTGPEPICTCVGKNCFCEGEA